MPIRTAADIHRLTRGATAQPVTSATEYERAHREAMARRALSPVASAAQPPVYVDGWKWCLVCAGADCDNRPAVGWGIACCFDCGAVYTGLTLPDAAAEIERILALRPKLSQRSWLPTESIADLQAENLSLGVPT